MTPLNIVFMGTPDFAVPTLQALINSSHRVAAVYTQPPRPKGRGQQVKMSPVHEVALAHGIPVFTPKSLRRDATAQNVFADHSADVAIVAAYGLLLPPTVLIAPKHGCLNVHASLLPRWRGAAPIQYAIWAGDAESGISLMQMAEGLDTGPVIAKRAVGIHATTTAQSLHDELSALGAVLTIEMLDQLALNGTLLSTLQDDSRATHAPMLTKDDGRIDWHKPAEQIDCQIRALNPWPGTWTINNGKRLKILAAEIIPGRFTQPPSTLVDRHGHVVCGDGTTLRVLRVQPENARAMVILDAMNGGYLSTEWPLR